jgi:hypothetical protein
MVSLKSIYQKKETRLDSCLIIEDKHAVDKLDLLPRSAVVTPAITSGQNHGDANHSGES